MEPTEVEEFMAAEKVVPAEGDSPKPIEWIEADNGRGVAWRGPVVVNGVQEGSVRLYANPNFSRAWHFALLLHSEQVYRLDVKPDLRKHRNPPQCPEEFPGRIRCREHEHIWVADLDLKCARAVEGLSNASHEEALQLFCRRGRIQFQPGHTEPGRGVQLAL